MMAMTTPISSAASRDRAGHPFLAIVNRPTQFDPPLWAALARRGVLDPTVWYVNSGGFVDPETGNPLNWGGTDDVTYQSDYVPRDQLVGRFRALTPPPVALLCEGWALRYTWALAAACWRRGVPMILPSDRVASATEPAPRKLARRAARILTAPVFAGHITPGSLGEAALASDGVAADRIARSLYPIDTKLFQRRLAEQAATSQGLRGRWPAGSKIVIAVAKHAERESPLLILDTYAAARAHDPSIKLIFVGDGPMRAEVEAHVVALGLSDDVALPGYVRYPLLAGYYGAADVFLHVAAFEPWGISVGEAMACGLPVVTTANVGASTDLVIPGKTGAMAARADAGDLAAKLVDVLAFAGTPDARAAIAEQVRIVDVETAAIALETLVARISRRSPNP